MYNLISIYFQRLKAREISKSSRISLVQNKFKHFNSYISRIETKLFNLGYPYKLTVKKYLFIKFAFPVLVFIIANINYGKSVVSLIFSFLSFYILDYLLHIYKKQERYTIINELKNLTNSLILNLSSYSSLRDSLKNSEKSLKYIRFKEAYQRFVYDYEMNEYNLKRGTTKFKESFTSYELSLFLSTLSQSEKEGNLIEGLEKFYATLELNYFKYLKRKLATRLLYMTLGTVLSLIDIVLVVMYPIFVQVLNSLQTIFS